VILCPFFKAKLTISNRLTSEAEERKGGGTEYHVPIFTCHRGGNQVKIEFKYRAGAGHE